MGTEYPVFKNRDFEIALYEMSNKFHMITEEKNECGEPRVISIPKLTPENLVEMAVELINTAMYWSNTEDLVKAANKKFKEIHGSFSGDEIKDFCKAFIEECK